MVSKKSNTIKIKLNYITNFNPNTKVSLKTLNKNNNTSGDRLSCKNFVLFLLIIKNIFKNSKISFFVKPRKCSLFNILRAPYKNKMSKHQIKFNRFFISVSINLRLQETISLNNLEKIKKILIFSKNFYSFFESNICFQHKSSLMLKFNLNNFFLI